MNEPVTGENPRGTGPDATGPDGTVPDRTVPDRTVPSGIVPSGIVIVGSGIKVPDQLTLEAVEVLRRASEIWTNVAESEHGRLAEIVGHRPNSLWPFYQAGRQRLANYEAVTEHLIERANAVREVAYLTQGHPLVLDRVATNVLRRGRQSGLPVTVLPGLSSIDTLIADLEYEPARGLQVFDATNFVRRQMKADGHAGLLLLQPGVFGVEVPRLTADAPPPQLRTLRDALCQIYPEDHPAILIRSATTSMKRRSFQTTVGLLDQAPPEALAASTLWVPPMDWPRRGQVNRAEDPAFAAR
jgi:siroheme synthase